MLSLTDKYCEIGPDSSDLKSSAFHVEFTVTARYQSAHEQQLPFIHACPPVRENNGFTLDFFIRDNSVKETTFYS